jgi:ribulose-phosphate 3-epimerase
MRVEVDSTERGGERATRRRRYGSAYVLLLAVNPGWGGQSFIPATEERLATARRLIEASGSDILLGVDGGITRGNIARVAGMGPDVIVAGSAVFDGKAPAENARFMLDQVKAARRPIAVGD